MSSILLLGDNTRAEKYLADYTRDNNIPSYNITVMQDVKVDEARQLKKKISFKSSENRLFVIKKEITIEAQNALLKCVEEHEDMTHFIFHVEKEEDLLPTIRSRCFIVRLGNASSMSTQTEKLLEQFFSNPNADWNIIEELSLTFPEQGAEQFVSSLRCLMLKNTDNRQKILPYYNACKTTLQMLPFITNNNVNPKILLERALIAKNI